jgi:hypothetical protein
MHMINGGSSSDFENKRQKKDHYWRVNHVAIIGPVIHTKWSHVPLTFDARDIDLRNTPHADALIINCNVVGWELHKVLSIMGVKLALPSYRASIVWASTTACSSQSTTHYTVFGGKGPFPLSMIELPLSLGTTNARFKHVTFDIVNMVYLYNVIMGRGSINKLEASIHGLYLCMKILGPQGMITIYGNQQTACNIKRDLVLGQRNVHCLTTKGEGPSNHRPKKAATIKAQIQSNEEAKKVPLEVSAPK